MSKKMVKQITAIDSALLEAAVNKFLETEGSRWRLVCVVNGPGYRTAWLEFKS